MYQMFEICCQILTKLYMTYSLSHRFIYIKALGTFGYFLSSHITVLMKNDLHTSGYMYLPSRAIIFWLRKIKIYKEIMTSFSNNILAKLFCFDMHILNKDFSTLLLQDYKLSN